MQLEKVRIFVKNNVLLNKGDTVIVAVSGGPDSLCLLHILKELTPEFKLNLIVAHLNHCLRPEASQEADGVRKLSSAWSLPFESRAVDIRSYKKELGISEEEAGRKARYSFLFEVAQKYGASKIALGHHLDDQAETVLLNLIRGTGIDGLAGMLPRRHRGNVFLIRPLLGLRRSDIESYNLEHQLEPFTDSSNLETNYTRNRLRLELIPQLQEQYNPRIREALIRLASLAADDRLFLKNLAKKKYINLARFVDQKTILDKHALLDLPPALTGRVLRVALQKYVPVAEIGNIHIRQLLDLAEDGRTGRKLTLPGRLDAYTSYNHLVIKRLIASDQEEFAPAKLQIPGKVTLPGGRVISARIEDAGNLSWPPAAYRAYLDLDKVSSDYLIIRPRRSGDRFHPQGAPGSKKLKSFLIDQKVPFYKRLNLPLVTKGEEIVWVAGMRIADPYKISGETEQAVVLEYKVLKSPVKRKKFQVKGGN